MKKTYFLLFIINLFCFTNISTTACSTFVLSEANTYQLDFDSAQQYENSFTNMFQEMINKNDLLYYQPQDTNNNPRIANEVFKVANPLNEHKYLIIDEKYHNNDIKVIIEPKYWYIEGFVPVTNEDLTYYFFDKAKITNLSWVQHSYELHYSGSYPSLTSYKNDNISFTKSDIPLTFSNLLTVKKDIDFNTIKLNLILTIFMTVESLRFFSVRNAMIALLEKGQNINWSTDYLSNILRSWAKDSKLYYHKQTAEAKNNISVLNYSAKH